MLQHSSLRILPIRKVNDFMKGLLFLEINLLPLLLWSLLLGKS